jgi:hypothetical protein
LIGDRTLHVQVPLLHCNCTLLFMWMWLLKEKG